VAHKFLAELLNHNEVRGLPSDEHFSVAARAPMKSFGAKDGSDEPPPEGRNSERDSAARRAAMPPVFQRRTLRRSFTRRGRARKPGSASSATR
jgi:hypothetical protein